MSAPARRNPLAAATDITLADAGNQPATLPIAQIRRDGGTQPRQGIDEDAVNDYANALRNGERLPAVDVMFDGSAYWLFDGFHRTEAHLRAGREEIAVTVHRGTIEDAQWRSFGANKGHGLRRTNADKERAVRAALRHPTGATLSNVQIAKHVGVDDKTVARYRTEMESTSEIPRLETRTGADGKERKTPPTLRYLTADETEALIRQKIAKDCSHQTPAEILTWLGNGYPAHFYRRALAGGANFVETTFRQALDAVRSSYTNATQLAPPSPTPHWQLATAVRSWLATYDDAHGHGRSQVELLRATRHTNAPGRVALEKALTADGVTWRKSDLTQVIDDVRSQMVIANSLAAMEQADPAAFVMPPPSPTPPVTPSPSLPADLAAAGWELRQVGGVGGWYGHNARRSISTATYDRAEEAMAAVREVEPSAGSEATEATDDRDTMIALIHLSRTAWVTLRNALAKRSFDYVADGTVQALLAAVDEVLGV